jgi:hypothetical protein
MSYPLAVILLAMGDIKACLCFAWIHTDLTGAFGFFADDLYNLATAMVFGSTTSTSSWEPFWRAIKSLSEVFANRPDLVKKHKKYLDMIGWAKLDPDMPITPACACKMDRKEFACTHLRGWCAASGTV